MIFEQRGYLDPDVQRLVDEVQQEYVVRYGGPDAAQVDPDEFVLPNGLFLLGVVDGVPAVTGAWRRLAADEAEIKRMFVSAPFRGRGLSRLMLAELERTAAAAGVRRLVLNTGSRQPEAIALYESSGYAPATPFGHYADMPKALFYGKTIEPAPQLRDGLGT